MATFLDLEAIRVSADFTKRSKAAIIKYANYILGQTPAVTGGAIVGKLKWAAYAALNPDPVFDTYQHVFIRDSLITSLADATTDTSTLTDANFDSIVQTAIETTLPAF